RSRSTNAETGQLRAEFTVGPYLYSESGSTATRVPRPGAGSKTGSTATTSTRGGGEAKAPAAGLCPGWRASSPACPYLGLGSQPIPLRLPSKWWAPPLGHVSWKGGRVGRPFRKWISDLRRLVDDLLGRQGRQCAAEERTPARLRLRDHLVVE